MPRVGNVPLVVRVPLQESGFSGRNECEGS